MREYDVAVVGGGPAGLILASGLSGDLEVVLFEEHKVVGVPQHCAGIIGPRALSILGRAAVESVVNEYREAVLYSPSLVPITLRGKPVAVLLDRVGFEERLLEQIAGRVHVRLGVRVIDVQDPVLTTSEGRLKARVTVVCEGASRRITRRHLGLDTPSLLGLQVDLKCSECSLDVDQVAAFFNSRYSPGFFSWVAPIDKKRVRVGIGGLLGRVSVARLEGFIKFLTSRGFLRPSSHGRPFGGLIVSEPPPPRYHRGSIAFLGDAVAHTKPITGGGLYVISLTASALSSSLNELLLERGSEEALKNYEERCKGVRRSLLVQYTASKVLRLLSDEVKDLLWSAARDSGLVEKAFKHSDWDTHDRLIVKALLSPELLKMLPLTVARVVSAVARSATRRIPHL